jgi:DNA modification methylase
MAEDQCAARAELKTEKRMVKELQHSVQYFKLSQIKPNPNNPRLIKDDKFKKLVQSLKDLPEMADVRPIVVNTDMIVLGGNMRLKAMQEAGWKEAPVQIVDWPEEKQRQFIIKDNVGFGEWDWDMLGNEWDQEQLIDWGMDIPGFALQTPEAEEDEYEIPDTITTDIVLGDLFEIGPHRLLCGDSTNADDVQKLMNGKTAELLFTSPPYSDMREYNGEKDLSVSNLIEFIPTFMPYANYQVINLGIQRKDNEVVQYWDDYISMAKSCGYKLLSWNIWNRDIARSIAHQTAMFAIAHEWLFVFGKDAKELNKTIECKLAGKANSSGRRNKDGTMAERRQNTIGDYKKLSTVLDCGVASTGEHPAMFPVDLPAEYIQAMTNVGELVAEPFTGSGTTMVAAHQLNRKCYGMELDPKYCQITIDRMLTLDPSLQIKRNGQPYKNCEETAING